MGKPLLSAMMTPSEAIVCLGAVMRRRLAVFWITLVVTALGVVAAPPAAAADLPPGEYLWAATTTQTLVYDRSQLTPVLVEQTDNTPTGGLVRSVDQFGDWVFVTTTGGIDMFDATTGQVLDSFSGSANGYQQVAAVPSIAGTTVYGLQTGGTVVDVFLANSSQLVTSITLPGPATYMSPARPPNGDYIVLGSVLNNNDQQYLSAAITTADNSVKYFNAPTRQVVNGAVWGPTDGRAYLSSTNLDSTTGSIGTYTPPLAYANTPIAAGVTPKQIAINTDGSRLYLPALDATGHSSIQIVDTSTLSTVEALELGTISTFGVPAFAPDGKLYVPPGATGLTNSVVMVDTKGAEPVSLPIGGSSSVLGVLVGDLPSAVQATGGANQKMYVDRQFDSPAVVTVVDPAGTPLPGQLVQLHQPGHQRRSLPGLRDLPGLHRSRRDGDLAADGRRVDAGRGVRGRVRGGGDRRDLPAHHPPLADAADDHGARGRRRVGRRDLHPRGRPWHLAAHRLHGHRYRRDDPGERRADRAGRHQPDHRHGADQRGHLHVHRHREHSEGRLDVGAVGADQRRHPGDDLRQPASGNRRDAVPLQLHRRGGAHSDGDPQSGHIATRRAHLRRRDGDDLGHAGR